MAAYAIIRTLEWHLVNIMKPAVSISSLFRLGFCLMLCLWLGACATAPEQPAGDEPGEAALSRSDIEPEQPAEPIYKPFPTDTLYALLVAEFALQRHQYTTAIGHYLDQAHKTRDPNVAAHATHLARYLKAERATMDAAMLWASIEPDSIEANYLASLALTQNRKPRLALNYMARVSQLGGDTSYYLIANNANVQGDGELNDLIADFELLLDNDPENTDLQLSIALLQYQAKQYDEALHNVQRALKTEPDNIRCLSLEANILLKLGRSYTDAFRNIARRLQADPKNTRLRLHYARLLTRYDMLKSQQQFEILVDQAPNDADLIFSLALLSREVGKTALARQQLERLLSLGQRESEAHYYLGLLAEEMKQDDEAIEHYKSVTPGPDFLPALKRASHLLLRQERYEEAIFHLYRMRQTYPDEAIRLYLLQSDVLMKMSRLNDGLTLLTEALEQHPDNTSLLYSRAMLSEKLDNIDLAESDLRKLLVLNPDNSLALNALGYTLTDRTDRHEEARDLIARAYQLQPDDPAILDSMGWVSYHLGQYEKALDYLAKAYAAFPDPEVAAHYGEVLWTTGDQQRALQIWQQALEKNPQSKILLNTLKKFEVPLERDIRIDIPTE